MKRTHIIALIFIVIAVGAIISTLYNADTYVSFSEAREHPGRQFHIIGDLNRDMPIEEKVEENTLTLRFYLVDRAGEEVQVLYFGAKPQDFEQSDEVVLIGNYDSGQFVANSLLLKCPSKYKPEEIGQTEYLFD